MRRVTCKDCKKIYDYDKDDFCPRCGSYNPPAETGSTALERELLARFQGGRSNQARSRKQQTSSVYRQPSTQWSPHPKPDQGHANHTPIGSGAGMSCEEGPKPSGKPALALIAVVVWLLFFVLSGILSLLGEL